MRTMKRAAALKALWLAVVRRNSPGGRSVREQLSATPRMLWMAATGRYKGLQPSRLGMMALGMLYVISPVDLVPEAALLLVGLVDDAVVVAWLAGTLLSEVDAFLDWEQARAGARDRWAAQEQQRPDVVPGEVVDSAV